MVVAVKEVDITLLTEPPYNKKISIIFVRRQLTLRRSTVQDFYNIYIELLNLYHTVPSFVESDVEFADTTKTIFTKLSIQKEETFSNSSYT